MDPRNTQLAKNLINYSCALKKGEKILIEAKGQDCVPLVTEIIKEAVAVGGLPFVEFYNERIDRALRMNITEEQLKLMAELDCKRMDNMDAYIRIGADNNVNELGDVPSDKQDIYAKLYYKPVHFDIRLLSKKWVVLRYPTANMAQSAKSSTEAFEDFYYKVCNLDYKKMSAAMDSMSALMSKTDRVRIVGPGTDLRFSIKGIPSVKCDGLRNIPDGEIYTAPVKDSVEGYLSYNTPAVYRGFEYSGIKLEFKNGKIVNSAANDTERITSVFNTDEGARYIGEFSFGVNPYITKPMLDTLFDEKIMGSFHFTPGASYDEAFNGNKSAIHWDLVCIQTPEYGGGEIYFDDVLIRKDGRFVIDSLQCLNPENLM